MLEQWVHKINFDKKRILRRIRTNGGGLFFSFFANSWTTRGISKSQICVGTGKTWKRDPGSGILTAHWKPQYNQNFRWCHVLKQQYVTYTITMSTP